MMRKKNIPIEFSKDDVGFNNGDIIAASTRVKNNGTYKDVSTVWVCPTRGVIPARVVTGWLQLRKPMNGNVIGPIFEEKEEVGIAYQKLFDMILSHPELSQWKYILTVEEDNIPPASGLEMLYQSIEMGYDCVGGLYWTKSAHLGDICSQPMIYGNPSEMPRNFQPQVPLPNTLQPCNGLGMGFNLWKISSLKRKLKDMPKPWFKTGPNHTQDLYFFSEASKYGFRCACDTRVKVGHYDLKTDMVW